MNAREPFCSRTVPSTLFDITLFEVLAVRYRFLFPPRVMMPVGDLEQVSKSSGSGTLMALPGEYLLTRQQFNSPL